MRVLRCLRDLEKWSWIQKMGKNEEKWLSENPQLYTTAVYQKYLTRLGELIIFEPWRENYNFCQAS